MTTEARPGTPEEAIAKNQKSVLRQVVDILQARSEGTNAYLNFEFIRIEDGTLMQVVNGIPTSLDPSTINVLISPIKPTFGIHELNIFSSGIFHSIAGIVEPGKGNTKAIIETTRRLDGKGVITFPKLILNEILGTRTNTAQVEITSDDPFISKDEIVQEKNPLRRSTVFIIYPSEEMRHIASLTFQGKDASLPKEFKKYAYKVNFRYGVSAKLLEAVKKNAPEV